MSATKREEVSSHLRYISLELREMHQMLIKDDLLLSLKQFFNLKKINMGVKKDHIV